MSSTVKLPGITKPVKGTDPIYLGSLFTWAEATKGLTRIPTSSAITANIVKAARYMDEVRRFLGDRPITVNSWYRDPVSNRAVGGVSNSQHLTGLAVDFVVSGIHPLDVCAKLDAWHGDKGGLGRYEVFTHIDLRGHKARWEGAA